MSSEELARMLADLAREHAPEATFSPPLQLGETTIICASSVSCLAGSRGPNLLISLRASPCAVIAISRDRCTVLPLGAPGTVDRLLEVAPRLFDLLDGKTRATAPGSPDDEVGRSSDSPPTDEARPGAGPQTSVRDRSG